MPRKNQNARNRWRPALENLENLEFGTPLMVSTPGGDVDFSLLIGAWALVFAAYCFIAHFVFVTAIGLWGVSLAVI